jgi:hypothetical protein
VDPESGKFVVIAITAVGALAWLAGLTSVLRASRERRESALRAAERFDIREGSAPGTIVGEAEVEGQPEELSAKLAGQLARDSFGPFGPVKIVARDRHEVAFEPAGRSLMGFRGGRVRLEPAGSRTHISYAIETSPGVMLIAGWIALALGLAAVIGEAWIMFTFVIPDPKLHGQEIQAIQMVHFLWPPFLFAHLARQPGRMFRARMDALVHNLPYS